MAKLTITEALADIKTIGKRLAKKRETVTAHLIRFDILRDPFEADGGSKIYIERELQGITDLELRLVRLRTAIQRANHVTVVTIAGAAKTIAEWLTWRKEVAPGLQSFNGTLRASIVNARKAERTGRGPTGEQLPTGMSLIVNVDEKQLAVTVEQLETILGTLDGQLSLTNATTFVEIPD